MCLTVKSGTLDVFGDRFYYQYPSKKFNQKDEIQLSFP